MASKKDFAPNQRRRKQPASTNTRKAATPKKTVNKPTAKPKPAPAQPKATKPWKLIIVSLICIGLIGLLLNKLTKVDPREIRETSITALIDEKMSQEPVITNTSPERKIPVEQKTTNKPAPAFKPETKKVTETTTKKDKPTTIVNQIPVSDKSTEAEEKEPYQFYEMLTKSSVETETIEAYKSTPKTAKLKNKTLLQTGSFRNIKDADRMKARLILNNLPNVTVDKTESTNGIWYRVRTGPYLTFNTLKAALVKLNKMHITPLQIPLS